MLLIYIVCLLLAIPVGYVLVKTDEERRKEIDAIVNKEQPIETNDFLELRKEHELKDYKGCYILTNTDDNKKYVGQSIHVITRVNNHLTGHGNPDVFLDFSNGKHFVVQLIKYDSSKFADLNTMEKTFISRYNTCEKGYNRTHGNHS